jgi:hypothetical protein
MGHDMQWEIIMGHDIKVVYNGCFGGFGLSYKAVMRLAELKGREIYGFIDARYDTDDYSGERDNYRRVTEADKELLEKRRPLIHYLSVPEWKSDYNDHYVREESLYDNRHDPLLVQVVEELGDEANGLCARLRIVELPKGTLYRIDEYDGSESVQTQDSYDWTVAG